MNEPGERDPARGLSLVDKLLVEDEAERIEKLSVEELRAETRADGVDPDRVPDGEELRKRLMARGARERNAAAPPPEKVPPEPAAREAKPTATVVPLLRRQRLVMLLAAAFGVAVVVTVATRPDNPAQFHPDPTPREQAEQLRDDAIGSCAQGVWNVCKHRLDDAAKLDPAGESEPRVQKARADIANAEHPGPKGMDTPGK